MGIVVLFTLQLFFQVYDKISHVLFLTIQTSTFVNKVDNQFH